MGRVGLGAAFGGMGDQREVTNERRLMTHAGVLVYDLSLIARPGGTPGPQPIVSVSPRLHVNPKLWCSESSVPSRLARPDGDPEMIFRVEVDQRDEHAPVAGAADRA